jgi:hypothetical protein
MARAPSDTQQLQDGQALLDDLRRQFQARLHERPSPGPRISENWSSAHLPLTPGPTVTLGNGTRVCPTCGNAGVVTHNVPVHHPDFGRAFPCPDCDGGQRAVHLRAALQRQFGSAWLVDSPKFHQFELGDFDHLTPSQRIGKDAAIEAAIGWAERRALTPADFGLPTSTASDFVPTQSLILAGPVGLGKTALLSAAYTYRLGPDGAGLAIEYNRLMSLLLEHVRRDEDQDQADSAELLCHAAACAPVLFLDDLGNAPRDGEGVREETPGRQRWLFDIINHRYVHFLPTLITTNLDFDGLYRQFGAKVAERIVERFVWVPVGGVSLRLRYD